jgi:hypothetical protein
MIEVSGNISGRYVVVRSVTGACGSAAFMETGILIRKTIAVRQQRLLLDRGDDMAEILSVINSIVANMALAGNKIAHAFRS